MVTLPCHGCNSLAFQKPVVDLHTEIIDLCSTSPSLFVIYIFPYSLNAVIVPLLAFVLLLLYTAPLGLAGEISVIWFGFLITIKAVLRGWVSTKRKVQTFGQAPDQNSVAVWHLRWIVLWLWPGQRMVWPFAPVCPGGLRVGAALCQHQRDVLQGAGASGGARPLPAALELLPRA